MTAAVSALIFVGIGFAGLLLGTFVLAIAGYGAAVALLFLLRVLRRRTE